MSRRGSTQRESTCTKGYRMSSHCPPPPDSGSVPAGSRTYSDKLPILQPVCGRVRISPAIQGTKTLTRCDDDNISPELQTSRVPSPDRPLRYARMMRAPLPAGAACNSAHCTVHSNHKRCFPTRTLPLQHCRHSRHPRRGGLEFPDCGGHGTAQRRA